MQLAIHGKNHLQVTEALGGYVRQRLEKLDRYFPGEEATAQVVLSVQRARQTVEVTIPFEGRVLRAQESDPTMYAAVDLVLGKLERQVHKFRDRASRKRHAEPRGEVGGAESGAADEELVRTKRFPLKPMTVDEALLQMHLVGHDFFVFREAMTLEIQVIYRRREGGYGLIVGE